MELLRPASAPSAHCVPLRSTPTLSFHLQSAFNRNASPRRLSVFSHPSSAHHLKINYNDTILRRRLPLVSANATPPPPPPPPNSDTKNRKLLVVACSAVTVALAIANRVLYKLALVPMKEFPFFLAQLTTFGYVAIYFSILFTRYIAGTVTDEMLAFPKTPFIIIGFLEALGVVAGMYSGAQLPGPAIPILNQAFLVWQLAFSVLILGRRYSWNRLAGCFLVAAGVVLSVTSGSEQDQMLSGVGMIWPAMMITSTAFQAVASILKESVFIDAATRLKGKLLDIFVVNSYGSGFQALFVLLFLPVLSNLKGIPLPELPSYLRSGAACFLNIGANTTDCDGAPLLPLLYIITNIAFNISVLNLLKYSSAVVSSLAVMSSVPISIYILSLPLPYLPGGVNLSPFFVLGSVVLMLGLILYNFSWPLKQNSDTSRH
ncbi:protein CLT2, chloroplastic-like [Salvia miltiorrhiza]|uniref:protein CLT2, chloroplastic-like n=1 Tax=Salvia miltiorrhiza TaxID=226208 RepID=UPI0025AC47D4|nr:protein CLT2, chloroplastic-like [Salvia miltiorrhiza]